MNNNNYFDFMGKAICKKLKEKMPNGLRNSLSPVIFEIKAVIKHSKGRREAKKYSGMLLKLNIGCGDNTKDDYVNIDYSCKKCLHLDLRESLPFDDQSVSIVYSEHFLEHLLEQYALQFLRESYRILIPGGLFSVGVPDGQVLLESYANGQEIKDFKILDLPDVFPGNPTRMQIVNLMFRGFGHKYMYDYETLQRILTSIGFTNIYKRSFDPSIDSEQRRDWTIYVDAYKPK